MVTTTMVTTAMGAAMKAKAKKVVEYRGVYPYTYASAYIKPGTYRVEFRNNNHLCPWAYFYEGRRRVWDCNAIYAKTHTTKVKKP